MQALLIVALSLVLFTVAFVFGAQYTQHEEPDVEPARFRLTVYVDDRPIINADDESLYAATEKGPVTLPIVAAAEIGDHADGTACDRSQVGVYAKVERI